MKISGSQLQMHRKLTSMLMTALPLSLSAQQLWSSQTLLRKQQAPEQQTLTQLAHATPQLMATRLLIMSVYRIGPQLLQCYTQQMCQRRCLV